MRLFFLSPWAASDPLSLATVNCHINELAADPRVDCIDYFSFEHSFVDAPRIKMSAVRDSSLQHHPVPCSRIPILSVGRLRQHQRFKRDLLDMANVRRPDLVICRGTTGIFGHLLDQFLGIPYVVESFEPHAHYMLQTGTWQRWDPKFLLQRRWEQRVKRSAAGLVTVSRGYARHLQEQDGIDPALLQTVPCWVDAERFRIDPEARVRVRQELGIGDRLAVIYCGKFGGIYSPLSELAIFRQLQQLLAQPLFVLILTPHPRQPVIRTLHRSGFSQDQLFVDTVPPDRVPEYLNAADLAVSFINSGPWSFACSAIKHGEAWACGLPLLMPPGVGDEAGWLEAEAAGAIADFRQPSQLERAVHQLRLIMQQPVHRQRIRALALRERSPEPMRRVYQQLLERFAPE